MSTTTTNNSCHPCVRYIVYFEVFTNIALGSICSFLGIYYIATDDDANQYLNTIIIAAGLCSIVGALLLLLGTVKAKKSHVFTYLVLTTPSLFIETIKIGFEIIKFDLTLEAFTLSVLLFVGVWLVQYAVYVFYKQLKNKEETQEDVAEPVGTCSVESQTSEEKTEVVADDSVV